MSEPVATQEPAPEKLKLLRSPVSDDLIQRDELATGLQQAIGAEAIRHLGYAKENNPTLLRNSQATNLETFYDLFLAACISLFNKNQQVNALDSVSTYIGFFSLIWSTWLLTSLYDVRFVTDSVFERCARAVHMGVLVGFVTVSPNFETKEQDAVIFQTFSIIIMVSRLCIALQYGVIMWHTRKYKVTFLPLTIMVAINIVAAAIYLGVSFRFAYKNSDVFMFWYGVAAVEILITMGLSIYYNVLSFRGTHLLSRISLLTLIIFGEGVAQACGKITDIVDVGSHREWTGATVGVVAAGIGISYVIFMLYFDWMPTWEINEWRQLAWSLLHYPVHLSMTMFVEGIAQLILYWKCVENINHVGAGIGGRATAFLQNLVDTEESIPDRFPKLANYLYDEIHNFSRLYEPTYTDTQWALNESTVLIAQIDPESTTENPLEQLSKYLNAIFVCLENSLYQSYEVDFIEDTVEAFNTTEIHEQFENSTYFDWAIAQEYDHASRVRERFKIVFQYTFICGGIFFAFATLLYMVARRKKWTPWAAAGVFMNFVLSIGIALLAFIGNTTTTKIVEAEVIAEYIQLSEDAENGIAPPKPTAYATFVESPGVLPTLLGVYLLVLFVKHMMGDGPTFSFFKSWKGRDGSVTPPQQDHVQHISVHADTKYDPGAHYVGQHVPYDPYAQQHQQIPQRQPSARPYSILRTTEPVHYQQQYEQQQDQAYDPQGYSQQAYPQPAAYQQPPEQHTTVYEYSGNDGPRQP
ncbi:hypothetical protein B0T11DRAFT_117630 [Plectosphaerella cucumerina]|uniref:Uncharacterized protein n=1 Tax=Plectosphaerella cucumerina TaxID=40658 RepID=A0A8K0TDF8_9PEZI|nr:hypothetical protein B0T11DRAFT_117630 [Plectosphaerella cucumerina]